MDKFKQFKTSFRLIQMIGLLKKIHINYCPYIYEWNDGNWIIKIWKKNCCFHWTRGNWRLENDECFCQSVSLERGWLCCIFTGSWHLVLWIMAELRHYSRHEICRPVISQCQLCRLLPKKMQPRLIVLECWVWCLRK